MPTWDPNRYLSFESQRTRPARDLLARVHLGGASRIVDVGCGPANSTALLADRWPDAEVVGVDTSAEMIERARRAMPEQRFYQADLRQWRPDGPVDLVFCNAVLHWLPDHAGVFDRMLSWLGPGGWLAVQMPANFDEPSHVLMRKVARSARWESAVGEVLAESPIAAPAQYHRMLAGRGSVDIWSTEYIHALSGEDPVVEWVKGAGLRPLLDRLGPEDAAAYLAEYAGEIRRAYPPQRDGTTLFPFRRLFIVVQIF